MKTIRLTCFKASSVLDLLKKNTVASDVLQLEKSGATLNRPPSFT
jgi:hypothetical protein